jgi:hypothetical protein
LLPVLNVICLHPLLTFIYNRIGRYIFPLQFLKSLSLSGKTNMYWIIVCSILSCIIPSMEQNSYRKFSHQNSMVLNTMDHSHKMEGEYESKFKTSAHAETTN